MRAKEFIHESVDKLLPDQAGALPATYAIPELPNQDPYLQYRFGVALAGAKGAKKRLEDNVPDSGSASEWGENEIIVSYGHDAGEYIDDALKTMGLKGKKMISTPTSIETSQIKHVSPVQGFKGFK